MQSGIEASKKKFLINSASAVCARVLNLTLLVWLQQHLLRRISPEEYAIYPVVASVMYLAPIVSTFLTGGIVRFLMDAYARKDELRVTSLISSIFPTLILAAIGFAIVGVHFAVRIDRYLTIDPAHVSDARWMTGLLVLQFALTLPTSPFIVGFFVKQRYALWNLLDLSQQFLRMAILFTLLFGVSTRVLWVVVATCISSTLICLIRVIMSRRMLPGLHFRPALFRWNLAKELMIFGLWQTVGCISDFIFNAQSILLNKLGTAVDVTSFYVGNLIDMNIRSMLDTATDPIQPALHSFHSTDDRARLGEAYLRGGRYLMWASLFIATPLVIYSQTLIKLYIGAVYYQAAWVMSLMLLVYPFTFSNKFLFRIALAVGRVRLVTVGAILKQLLNLGLSIYLIYVWKMGAVGSALSIFISGVTVQLLFFWPLGLKMCHVTFRQFMNAAVWMGMLPAIGGSVCWLALKWMVEPSTWVELGFCVIAGCVPYLATLRLCLQPHERDDLSAIAQRLKLIVPARPAS